MRRGIHAFHTAEWWPDHWRKTGLVEVTCAEEPPESSAIWEEFIPHTGPQEQSALGSDAPGEGGLMFARVVAHKR